MSNEKLKAALQALMHQCEQMKGLFTDKDGTIQGALDDALLALLEPEPFVTLCLTKGEAQAFYDMTIDTMENYGHDKEYVEDDEQLARIEEFCALAAKMQKVCGTALDVAAGREPAPTPTGRVYMVVGFYADSIVDTGIGEMVETGGRWATHCTARSGEEAERVAVRAYAEENGEDVEQPLIAGTVFINDKGEMEIGS